MSEIEECCVCYEELKEEVCGLECKHKVCDDCLEKWIDESFVGINLPTCPKCRHPIQMEFIGRIIEKELREERGSIYCDLEDVD